MKYASIFLLISYFSIIFGNEQQPCQSDDQNLIIVMMVKNEADVMQKTLQPFFDAKVNNYLILDTGSTDDTVQVTRNLFKEHNITHGYIVEEPFVDFATSRNYAIKQAEKYFPRAVFFLMLDAEWYMHGVPELIQFCKDHATSAEKSYGLLINWCHLFKYYGYYLFKAHKGLKYVGAVHEYLTDHSGTLLPANIYAIHDPSNKGVAKSIKRAKKDCEWLLQDYKKEPKNGRTIYLLAQTYHNSGNMRKAIQWYKKKCDMPYKDDLTFLSYLYLGEIYQRQHKWKKAIESYIKAYIIEPTRAEPLIKIAQLYWETKDYPMCYIFALNAFNMPQPEEHVFMVNTNLYNYVNYDLLGRVAWRMGDCDFGKRVTLAALELHPNDVQLKANLQYYLN